MIEQEGFEQFRKDLEALMAQMAAFPEIAAGEIRLAGEQALMVLQSEAADYPASPPESEYRRTGTLGRLWVTGVREIGGRGINLWFRAGNRTPYGPYVQDPERQAWFHRARWQTTEEVVAENMDSVDQILGEAGGRIVEKLAGE